MYEGIREMDTMVCIVLQELEGAQYYSSSHVRRRFKLTRLKTIAGASSGRPH